MVKSLVDLRPLAARMGSAGMVAPVTDVTDAAPGRFSASATLTATCTMLAALGVAGAMLFTLGPGFAGRSVTGSPGRPALRARFRMGLGLGGMFSGGMGRL
jgi:hypothetical protein